MNAEIKILVVDDDPNIRKTLGDILRVKGYATAVAGTGAEAIAALESGDISLALIDLVLPDMPGLEVMARLKAMSPLTEAIILTGNASMDSAIEATSQGAFSYLVKPYQMDDLLRNIKHGVERQQAREEILRLSSFPRLSPSPVIELDSAGEITFLNPAAERLFPGLGAMGQSHPLLHDSMETIRVLRQDKKPEETISERAIGEVTYELHISYVQDVNRIRIYAVDITERKHAEVALQRYSAELENKNKELQEALAKVKQLTGMLPICASCKKVRDDRGYWSGVETYVSAHTDAVFSHGLCPECEKKEHEELAQLIRDNT
ncbi:response regulator [Geopsychrobacter electrodiphilus]|uniref:response regulator n=1 Tax=Geopsychrobacter electrodiphilus TaxID=225196 RepID=UPI000375E7CE|nr:response regulator [Geopsychrobacter electrodiphilus]